jgi:hypothetical protein
MKDDLVFVVRFCEQGRFWIVSRVHPRSDGSIDVNGYVRKGSLKECVEVMQVDAVETLLAPTTNVYSLPPDGRRY